MWQRKQQQALAAKTIQTVWRMHHARRKFKEKLKLHSYRTHVAEEILSTERLYVNQLFELVHHFLHPLRDANAAGKPIISDPEIRQIFSTVEIILATNKDMLEAPLVKRVEQQWHPNQLVGDIFVRMAGILKIYTEYIQNFNEALSQIQECKKSIVFLEFCNQAFPKFSFSVVDLPSLLITPIQRIPRYQLLLKDLLKHTWEDHPDHVNLTKALGLITDTANYVNQKKMEAENIQKCMAIQATLSGKGLESLIDPHRRFVREGSLKEVNDKGKLKQKWYILFNDILVHCEMSKTMTKSLTNKDKSKRGTMNLKDLTQQKLFKYKGKLLLEKASIVNLGDEGLKTHGFEVVTSRDSMWLCAHSKEEKDEWMKDLLDCIKETKDKLSAHDEQVTRIAKQRASLTKSLLSEQLMYRTRSSSTVSEDDLSKTLSSDTVEQQLRNLLEEGDVEDMAATTSTAAAGGGRTEKRSLRDFKKKVATGSRHQSLTVGALSIEALREQHAASADADDNSAGSVIVAGGGGDSPTGEKRTRKWVGLKRNSLKHGVGGSSSSGTSSTTSKDDLSPVSSPASNMRRFASKKNELMIAQKEKELADSTAAAATTLASADEPRTRRFAGMRRETWSGDRPSIGGESESSGEGDSVLPTVPNGASPVSSPSASPLPSPSAGKVRKFASLKRENYKDL